MRKYMEFVTVVQLAMISKHLDGICLDILWGWTVKLQRGKRWYIILNRDIVKRSSEAVEESRAAENGVNLPILESFQSLEDMRSIAGNHGVT